MPEDPYILFNTNINNSSPQQNNDILKKCNYTLFDNSYNIKECPISLEEFKEGDSIIELPCNHIFNENNIKNWLKEKPNCPVCRMELIPKEDNSLEQYSITHQIDTLIHFLSARMLSGETSGETIEESFNELFEIY